MVDLRVSEPTEPRQKIQSITLPSVKTELGVVGGRFVKAS